MTRFIGIDFSLTATGVAVLDSETGDWSTATIKTKPTKEPTPRSFIERVETIAAHVIRFSDPREGDVWAIESPALHAKSSSLDKMFGGWWMLVAALTAHHDEPVTFTPSEVKKFATGKGNAGKDEVLLAIARRFPTAPIHTNDEADAVALASILAARASA